MAKQTPKQQNSKQPQKQAPQVEKPMNIAPTVRTEPSKLYIFVLLFALAMILYGNTLYNGYSMDDELVTLDHLNVERGIKGIPNILSKRYSVNDKQNYEYRPVAVITYAIEYEFFGRNPGVSHFFNIFIYAITCFLIYLSIRKIFPLLHWVHVLMAAVIFLAMPVHNEVVVSLKNRDEMLSLIFALLALQMFLTVADRKKYSYLAFGIIFMLISFLAKKSSYPLIVIYPFIIIYTRKISWVKVIGGLAIVAVCIFILGKLILTKALTATEAEREMFFFENPLYVGKHSILEVLMMTLATFGFYVKMLIVPYPFACYYGYNTFEGFTFTLNHAIGLIAIALILYGLYKSYRTNKPLFVGLIFFCVSISMFANLVTPAVGIVAERFVFTASLGMALVFSQLIAIATKSLELPKKPNFSIIPGKLGFIILLYVGISATIIIPRNPDWNSTFSLYKADVVNFPQSTKLYSLLGTIHAQKLYKHANELNKPEMMNSQEGAQANSRLTADELKLQTDTVISFFRKALEIYPDYIPVNNNLGTIYFTFRPMLDSAGYFFERALKLDSTYVEAAYNLANYSESKAELAQQKYLYIKWLAPDTSKPSDKKVLEEQAKILESYEPIFSKIHLLKVTLNNTFSDMAEGRTKGDPKGQLLNVLLYYYRENPFLRPYEMNHLQLSDDLLAGFKFLNQQKKASLLEFAIDSIVNRYYFPVLTKAINAEKKIDMSKIDAGMRAYQYAKIFEFRNRCVALHKKTLRLSPNYVNSYGKLTGALAKWYMYDELIALHERLEKNPNFKKQTIDFSLAETYFAMGNFKKTAEYFISGLKRVEVIMKRLKLVRDNFVAANNATVVSSIDAARQSFKGNVGFYINKFMREISTRMPFEAVQVQQLFNMISSL